jgi:PAS domain S-box-containing protein
MDSRIRGGIRPQGAPERRVLIVEDDRAMAEVQRAAILGAGYSPAFAARTREAVELIRRQAFSAVLVEQHLAEDAEWRVLDAASSALPPAPVLVVVGAGEEPLAALEAGPGSDYLVKSGGFSERLPLALDRAVWEAEVDHARSLLAALVEFSADAILSATLDGTITSWNRGAERLYGYAAEEIVGRPVTLLVPHGHPGEDLRLLQRLALGERVEEVETLRRRRDGSLVEVSLTLSPILNSQGRAIGVSCIARDITERRRLEENRRRLAEIELINQRLAEANRARGSLLAAISHELRTPLTAIVGFSQLVRDGKAGRVTEKARGYLDLVLASAEHLLALIGGLLDLAKVDAGKLELRLAVIDPPALVHEVVEMLEPQAAHRGLSIACEIDAEVTSLIIDPTHLKQVLFNFLSNAIKFTPRGGRLTVRLAAEGPERFRLEVEDSGIGIRPEDLGKLFTEFVRLDSGLAPERPGTGLGLVLTKRVAEAMGGEVGVRSRPGEGSIFYAVLPRVVATQGAGREPLER